MRNLKVAVIGAGNGGQAMAGYLAKRKIRVSLYDRNPQKIYDLKKKGGIQLQGCEDGFAHVECFTSDIEEAINGAELIMVTTVANAHADVAHKIAPHMEDGQIIILNPGRTCGALVFKEALKNSGCTKRYYLGEAQTLVYACRLVENGIVNIIGIKGEVFLAGLPSSDTDYILAKVNPVYPCFKKAENVMRTSLENIGAIFHPCVCLFNAATIERQEQFWFYRDMSEHVAHFIERFDQERLAVGKAYGLELISAKEWIQYAYKDTRGGTLCERMRNNPAYHDIKAPGTIFTRQLTEDIPTGVLPMMELGKAAGINTQLFESVICTIETLLEMDFRTEGRSLKNLGLEGMGKDEIMNYICKEVR